MNQRPTLANEIVGILTATMEGLRADSRRVSTGMMREEATDYGL
jgi:hypothetical protein